jgi:hypothetical protein
MNKLILISLLWLAGCQTTVSLPVHEAWFEGKTVRYITTEVSDQKMAQQMNATYAPRLTNAVPNYPKPPGLRTVLERVYGFPGEEQRVVFASIPTPVGPTNDDTHYSPLWLMVEVRWQPGAEVRELQSEEAVLAAEEAGLVTLTRTNVVVNCPVIEVVL